MNINLTIDGLAVTGTAGQTILDIAKAHGIDIPTLCHDERVENYGACGICVVEAEGIPKLLRACSTAAAAGMVIRTATPRVIATRTAALELLLSDHTGDCRPPCVLACPAQTDCQGYAGLIANGEYREALKLVKDKIPLPSSIGRVCPHPCETACRRKLVEEPVSIAALKSFVGDLDLQGELYTMEVAPDSGKSIAIIGGGPGGLTAAYFLRAKGHAVTVYDAQPAMGGMLRYGIPEYRLPKALLQQEIDAIASMGVDLRNNIKIGRDISLEELRSTHDAVIVAVGAWTSSGLRCAGEELEGVLGGIDFLRDAQDYKEAFAGRKIAVVGGGNTAMDACRTAVRLGAEAVYNIYRRTKNEMPAEEIEIIEAEEEGVIFKNLVNPIEITGDGRVSAIRLQVMALGEPDASGRRSPVAVPGQEEHIAVDFVIAAIGQRLDPTGLEALERTRWGTIIADERSFLTSLPGVFAVGDATNNGADIAITAIGEAKAAVAMVERFLAGEALSYTPQYLVKAEKTPADFTQITKSARAKMPHRSAAERRRDFREVNLGLSEEAAKQEAARCLECGCQDYFECKLIDYANRYRVEPAKFSGKVHRHEEKDDHPYIHRNPEKCILCGLCVRICDEVVGAGAIGLVSRGFDTLVQPALGAPLRDTDCISCGQCVSVCPTGALTEGVMTPKTVPLRESVTETVCAQCSVGCKTQLMSKGSLLTRSLPAPAALLCEKGRFGFGALAAKPRLNRPLMDGTPAEFAQTAAYVRAHLQTIAQQKGMIALAVSPQYTNEEAALIKDYAAKVLHTNNIYSFGLVEGGLAEVLGRDASTASMEDLDQAQLIVALAPGLLGEHAVAAMRIRRAVNRGAKLLLLSDEDNLLDSAAALRLGLSALGDALPDSAAKLLAQADRAVFIFAKQSVSAESARRFAALAVESGHKSGILQLQPGANSQGLSNLGYLPGAALRTAAASGELKALLLFGEAPEDFSSALPDSCFLAVQDLHMSPAAARANAVFPAASYAEGSGTYTAADGSVQHLKAAIDSPHPWNTAALIRALSE